MLICLDAGHSYGLNKQGKDPGAINEELGLKESVIAMEITKLIKQHLEEKNHKVILTRSDGSNDITLAKRCKIANENHVDLFVSIHLNSADNKQANGIETLRYPTKNPKTIAIANSVQHSLVNATQAVGRGVKLRDNLYVLKHTNMPAILVETGFISNKNEGLKLNDPSYQRVIAKAIVEGILNAS